MSSTLGHWALKGLRHVGRWSAKTDSAVIGRNRVDQTGRLEPVLEVGWTLGRPFLGARA